MRSHIKLIEKIRKNTKKKLLACDDLCVFLLQVLIEAPAVFGPKQGSSLVCIQCCRTLPAIQVPTLYLGLHGAQTWPVSSAAGLYLQYRQPRCSWVLAELKLGLYPVLQDSTSYIIQVPTLYLGLSRAPGLYPVLQDFASYSIQVPTWY
jgi:hypothetical protein